MPDILYYTKNKLGFKPQLKMIGNLSFLIEIKDPIEALANNKNYICIGTNTGQVFVYATATQELIEILRYRETIHGLTINQPDDLLVENGYYNEYKNLNTGKRWSYTTDFDTNISNNFFCFVDHGFIGVYDLKIY